MRRKLKIETKPVDAAAIIAEEKRKEADKMEEKEQKAKENLHDLEMLKAVVNSSYVNGTSDTPPAEKTLEQAVSSSIDPNIGPSGSIPASQPAASVQRPVGSAPGEAVVKGHSDAAGSGAPLSRRNTKDSDASKGSKKGKSPARVDNTPAMTLRPGFDSQIKDNSDDDDDDDDLEDDA